MLVSLNQLYPSFSTKTLSDHSLFPSPLTKFPTFLNPKPSEFLVRTSHSDSHTLPQSAIQRIADKLRSLGFTEPPSAKTQIPIQNPNLEPEDNNSAGQIFIPLPNRLPKYRVGHTLDQSWNTPEKPVSNSGAGNGLERRLGRKKERVPTLAELRLPKAELRRLTTLGIGLRTKIKVGKPGITEGIVNGIHERWRSTEVVKVVCEDLCKLNMKRTHDLLERKTGGMVVWRSGSKAILYRGANYKYPYFLFNNNSMNKTSDDDLPHTSIEYGGLDKVERCLSIVDDAKSCEPSSDKTMVQPVLIQGVGSPNRVRFQLPGEALLAEEADRLLDGLGPRFTDWWGYDPLPVDADLLPAVIPGYRRPFRLLPYGVNPKLTGDEMTILRRLGRPLPCHFALGRNRKLQGLAASIVKLWEKCEIAKIAVKRSVQDTNSEAMAEELKWLTGGTLISRDDEFIVLYRGKDFLPPAVSSAINERRKHAIDRVKQRAVITEPGKTAQEHLVGSGECGSEGEPGGTNDGGSVLYEQRKPMSTEAAFESNSSKLSMALEKKAKAEKLLEELEKGKVPQQSEPDKERITEEERYMLRKVGLQMKPYLPMGRRGIFDGTVENMHLHWKYRELVKIICNEKSIEAVNQVAQTLEAESGGILVAVERVRKGYAIIVYRGKKYERPARLRPPTLLTKRQAMKRSLEEQRCESLKLHVLRLNRNIDELKNQLVKDKEALSAQSTDESKFQFVKEEMNSTPLAGCVQSDSKLDSHNYSLPVIHAHHEENAEFKARDKHGADSTSMGLNDGWDTSISSLQATQRETLTSFYITNNGDEKGETELKSSSESISKETGASVFMGVNRKGGLVDSTSCTDNFMSEAVRGSAISTTQHFLSHNEAMGSSVLTRELKHSIPVGADNGSNEMRTKTLHLSNRDRLLLRKQALKMKKRPVLAVGRSNIVTGVAKAIRAHFQKHPLAVVNVKGRAKGTTIQELVSKLEQATGAVLVSQEPTKVILYRGWGAGDNEPGHSDKKGASGGGETSVGTVGGVRHAVSPELLAAIRMECGLPRGQVEKVRP